MGLTAVELVAGVIDQIERAVTGTGRPPPQHQQSPSLRRFASSCRKACRGGSLGITGSRLRINVAPSANGMGRNGPLAPRPAVLICMVRSGPEAAKA